MTHCEDDPVLFDRSSNLTRLLLAALGDFKRTYNPVHGYLCAMICLFGVVTNLIHILVLTRANMRTSAVNAILTAIAICDMLLMTSYLFYLLNFVFGVQMPCYNAYTYYWMAFLLCHVVLSIKLHSTSLWLAVLMAFVRRMTLKTARLNSRWHRPSYAWLMCLAAYLVVFLLCLPTFLVHEIRSLGDWPIGEPANSCLTTDGDWLNVSMFTIGIPDLASRNRCRLFKANLWLSGLAFKVIPCALLMLLSVDLINRVRAAEKKRRRLFDPRRTASTSTVASSVTAAIGQTNSSNNNNPPPPLLATLRKRTTGKGMTDRTTAMLVAILLVFLVTELPQGAIAIINAIFTTDVHSVIYLNLGDLLDLLSLINSSVNFVLMCLMSSRYRQTFWTVVIPSGLYGRCCHHDDDLAEQTMVGGRSQTITTAGGTDSKFGAFLSAGRMRSFGALGRTTVLQSQRRPSKTAMVVLHNSSTGASRPTPLVIANGGAMSPPRRAKSVAFTPAQMARTSAVATAPIVPAPRIELKLQSPSVVDWQPGLLSAPDVHYRRRRLSPDSNGGDPVSEPLLSDTQATVPLMTDDGCAVSPSSSAVSTTTEERGLWAVSRFNTTDNLADGEDSSGDAFL